MLRNGGFCHIKQHKMRDKITFSAVLETCSSKIVLSHFQQKTDPNVQVTIDTGYSLSYIHLKISANLLRINRHWNHNRCWSLNLKLNFRQV